MLSTKPLYFHRRGHCCGRKSVRLLKVPLWTRNHIYIFFFNTVLWNIGMLTAINKIYNLLNIVDNADTNKEGQNAFGWSASLDSETHVWEQIIVQYSAGRHSNSITPIALEYFTRCSILEASLHSLKIFDWTDAHGTPSTNQSIVKNF